MENQGKSPKELLAEFQNSYLNAPTELEQMMMQRPEDWLLSSLSDLLRWSAEQMPEKNGFCETEMEQGYDTAIDDCKATLLRLADEICKK